jgi:hypothetical protein
MATDRQSGSDLGEVAQVLNDKVDCLDLAIRLGLDRPGGKGNFRSPHHTDKAPSVSIYQGKDGSGLHRWKDYSTDEGGKAVDM